MKAKGERWRVLVAMLVVVLTVGALADFVGGHHLRSGISAAAVALLLSALALTRQHREISRVDAASRGWVPSFGYLAMFAGGTVVAGAVAVMLFRDLASGRVRGSGDFLFTGIGFLASVATFGFSAISLFLGTCLRLGFLTRAARFWFPPARTEE